MVVFLFYFYSFLLFWGGDLEIKIQNFNEL